MLYGDPANLVGKTLSLLQANIKGADHPLTLVSAFLSSVEYNNNTRYILNSIVKLVYVVEQAELSLTWSKNPRVEAHMFSIHFRLQANLVA